MNYFKVYAVSLLIALSSQTFANGSKDPFQVRFTAKKSQAQAHQKLVELKMVKSLAFCRGFYIAKKVTPWTCDKKISGKVSCSSNFRCSNIHRGFNRASEQKRLKSELASYKGKKLSKHKLFVGKRPYGSSRLKKAVVKVEKLKKVEPKNSVMKIEKVTGPLVFKEEGIELFNEDNEEQDKNWRFAEVDHEKIIDEKRKKDRFQLRRFTTQIIYAGDDEENTYFTILGLSYTPIVRLTANTSLQLEAGLHQFSLEESAAFEKESFFVYTYSAELHYSLGERYSAHAGIGLQPWGASRFKSPSFFRVSYGGTYHFKKNLLSYIDRAFLTISNLQTDLSSVTEIRTGFGFTF
jgi:hypothetical protein